MFDNFCRAGTVFRKDPTFFYGLTIAASWAGVGSLLNSITMTQTCGIVPSLIWSAANILACVLFGWTVHKLPTLRDVMRLDVVRYIIAAMSIFQIWLNMNGIQAVFSDTPIGKDGGTMLAYAVAVGFILLLLWRGMIRNILTDGASWLSVYGLIALLTAFAFIDSGGEFNSMRLGLDNASMLEGVEKAFLLLPGPFTFIYFYELLNYNDSNSDGTHKADMQQAFTLGGLLFGVYMAFAFVLAFVNFSPELNLIKAVLISLVAISTLSTFIYSNYIVFGRKLGLLVDVIAVALWSEFMELGVMGVWVMVASIRQYLVAAFITLAIVMMMKRHKR